MIHRLARFAATSAFRPLLIVWSALVLVPALRAQAVEIVVDCSKTVGTLRPLLGVNSGPIPAGGTLDLSDRFRELGVTLTRLHDCHWPNPEVVDVHTIFPDPAADPSRPQSYRFERTDDYVRSILDVRSAIIYRLGESIEHT